MIILSDLHIIIHNCEERAEAIFEAKGNTYIIGG